MVSRILFYDLKYYLFWKIKRVLNYCFIFQRKKNPEGGPIDRAMMWKKARERKSGEIDEELTPVLREIVSNFNTNCYNM